MLVDSLTVRLQNCKDKVLVSETTRIPGVALVYLGLLYPWILWTIKHYLLVLESKETLFPV